MCVCTYNSKFVWKSFSLSFSLFFFVYAPRIQSFYFVSQFYLSYSNTHWHNQSDSSRFILFHLKRRSLLFCMLKCWFFITFHRFWMGWDLCSMKTSNWFVFINFLVIVVRFLHTILCGPDFEKKGRERARGKCREGDTEKMGNKFLWSILQNRCILPIVISSAYCFRVY